VKAGAAARARFAYRAYRARWRDQRAEMREMLRLIHPGDVAVDIGAHKGAYLYWMQKAVGARGKVCAFEPQPQLHEYLAWAVPVMGWENVELSPLAISDRQGTATIRVPAGRGKTSPGASLEPAHGAGGGEPGGYEVQCSVDTLDRIFAGRKAPSFIKCDVEGHELSVFRGAARVLGERGPALLFECEQRHLSAHGLQDVFGFLQKLGYAGQFFAQGELLPLARFDPSIHQRQAGERFWDRKDYSNNFLFVRPR